MTARRAITSALVRELDRADINPDGSLYAWGSTYDGRHALWTFDPRQLPGEQERLVVIEDEKTQ